MAISYKKVQSEELNEVLHALLNEFNTLCMKFYVAARRAEEERPALDAYSQLTLLIWRRMNERKIDAELRALLEEGK